ncbi:DUF3466 family protein [Neiella sp. HB171785]|uniref:DUF3466 family protein n=1 Tax=Neiella litorisoli TaxID=2771431 RepID=A0A8J6QGU5_9GAMM|nr:DUF3466 family protein [Neiella litorisoli]MBD1389664.1 DUF3466 family protein [Neiella litorisoli]
MKQLHRCVSPICAAVLSALALNSHAALYEVIELTVSEEGEVHTYALDGTSPRSDTGVVVGAGSPIPVYDDGDLDPGDDENYPLTPAPENSNLGEYDLNGDGDEEEIVDEIEDADLRFMTAYQSKYKALINDSLREWDRVNVWDTINPEDGEYRETTDDYFFAVNDKRVATGYGSAPYYVYKWESEETHDETYAILRDFASRGFVYKAGDDPDGERVALYPEEMEFGGVSGAYDISDSNLVAGYASVSLVNGAREAHDACIYDRNLPEIVCDYEANSGQIGFSVYNIEAFLWQLDSNQNVVWTRSLGSPVELPPGVNARLVSQAYAANDNGYAAGSADNYVTPDNPSLQLLREYAVIYTQYSPNDVGILDITDRSVYQASSDSAVVSRATALNNNDIAIGFATRLVNGFWRTKAWYYDINADFPEMVEVPSFFDSSSMTAKSINDHDVIVGEFEWEPRPGNVTRRRHGYLYDIRSDTFIDLNDAVGCISDLDIVEANVIRNDGVILATATTQMPLLTVEGDPVFDSNGDPITTTVARAVALKPIDGGDYDNCTDKDEAFPKNKREGASFGMWLVALPIAWWFRRRYSVSR